MKNCLYYIRILAVPALLFFYTAIPAISANPDTIKVTSVGENNSVTVNSRQLDHSLYNMVNASVQGEITQTGQNNSVEIKTNDKSQNTNSKKQNTNSKSQETNCTFLRPNDQCLMTSDSLHYQCQVTNDKCPLTSDSSPSDPVRPDRPGGQSPVSSGSSRISVSQSGTNNSVKIISR